MCWKMCVPSSLVDKTQGCLKRIDGRPWTRPIHFNGPGTAQRDADMGLGASIGCSVELQAMTSWAQKGFSPYDYIGTNILIMNTESVDSDLKVGVLSVYGQTLISVGFSPCYVVNV